MDRGSLRRSLGLARTVAGDAGGASAGFCSLSQDRQALFIRELHLLPEHRGVVSALGYWRPWPSGQGNGAALAQIDGVQEQSCASALSATWFRRDGRGRLFRAYATRGRAEKLTVETDRDQWRNDGLPGLDPTWHSAIRGDGHLLEGHHFRGIHGQQGKGVE